jgi:hypothetical protein
VRGARHPRRRRQAGLPLGTSIPDTGQAPEPICGDRTWEPCPVENIFECDTDCEYLWRCRRDTPNQRCPGATGYVWFPSGPFCACITEDGHWDSTLDTACNGDWD